MQPIKRVSLHQSVADAVLLHIRENHLQAGDKLPSERELSRLLSLGRSSVREGLRILVGMDLIDVIVGKGIYVKRTAVIPLIDSINTEKISLLQAMEIRRMVERTSVELAIKHATDEDLREIEDTLCVFERSFRGGLPCEQEDLAFHLAVYRAAHNPILLQMIESIHDFFFQNWNRPLGSSALFADSFPFHRYVFEAIRARDLKKALEETHALMDILERDIVQFAHIMQ